MAFNSLLRVCKSLFQSRFHQRVSSEAIVNDPAVPLHPTWSVEKLLSTYPAPQLSDETLIRLHRLSAMHPPPPGSNQRERLILELQELLRLVEAVKLVDTSTLGAAEGAEIPDSRIWPKGRGIDLTSKANHILEARGEALLKHTSKQVDGQYVVESAPRSITGRQR